MCGIAGFSGQFSQELLFKMSERIAHRGPDDQGLQFINDNYNKVGLAHRRLSIIDLSTAASQPMTVSCQACYQAQGKLWITYNGEIYNYRELRQELSNKGHQFRTTSDTEVLIHLYQEYGTNMMQYLNGIYAFVIYDGRTNPGEMLVVRDGLGVKPLYYAETNQGFLFASELKSLLLCDAVPKALNLTALHYYLAYLWTPGDVTALSAVKKLQPGEALLVRAGAIAKKWFHYDIPYTGEYQNHSIIDSVNELDNKLRTAIKRQLIADVPVGAFLSGGLDSSSIVNYMRQQDPYSPIHCYSIGFDEGMQSEGNPDDLPYAYTVAKKFNLNIHPIIAKPDIVNDLQHMIYHLDEPQADPAGLHVYTIAKAAKSDGIKVLLSGAGGDDIFSGYRRHQIIRTDKFFQYLPMRMRQKIAYSAGSILNGESKYNLQNSYTRRLAKLMSAIDLPFDKQMIYHFIWGTESLRRTLYSPEMANALLNVDTAQPLLNSLQRIPSEKNYLNRMLYLETKHFLADHNLNYTDKMSMAAGVEVRVPLLDYDLVDFASKLPSKFKQHRNVSKYIFKKTMEAYLPSNIVYRKKAGFGAPLRKWLLHDLDPIVNDILSSAAIQQRGLFDANAVTQLIKQNKAGKVDASYTIFSLLCIEMWCRTFL